MIPLCFFNKKCIEKRKQEEAANNALVQEQQQLLLDISKKPTGGLNAWAITAIIVALAGITAVTIYMIKKRKKAK